jgi:hypothetical protein
MSGFKLVPADKTIAAYEYDALDASTVFNMVDQLNFSEAELWRGEHYVCTLKRSKAPHSYWMIIVKEESALVFGR